MKSALMIVSVTQRSSVAMAARTANVDMPPTTTLSVQALKPVGRFHHVKATETAATATSAQCITTLATQSASTTCRSAAVCATGNAHGHPDVGCGHPLVLGLLASDGEPYSLDRVACRGRRATSLQHRPHQQRPTRYRISCKNFEIHTALRCRLTLRTVQHIDKSKSDLIRKIHQFVVHL